MELPNYDVGDIGVTMKSGDVDADGMDTSNDTMRCIGYVILYQILGDDSE